MYKEVGLVIVLALIQNCHTACNNGFYDTPVLGIEPNKGQCTACPQYCSKCVLASGNPTCTEYSSRFKGVSGLTFTCGYGFFGYNSKADTCGPCIDGCKTCFIDYDVCYECYAGWEFDDVNFTCTRATLGLAATILVLSVVITVMAILTCVWANKLS